MTSTGGSSAPAGWFTDPGGSGQLRWWDGTAWTAHLTPAPTPAPTPTPVVQAPVIQTPVVQAPPTLAPVEQPYVPFQNSWSGGAYSGALGAGDEFARPAAWNTGWIWYLALSPLLLTVVSFAVGFLTGIARGNPSLAGGLGIVGIVVAIAELALIVLIFVAAFRDRTVLKSWGYLRVASPLWILFSLIIGPIVYIVIRTVRVYHEVRRGIAPLIVFIASGVLLGIGSVVLSLVLGSSPLAQLGGAGSTQFAASIQTGLDENGGHFTVTCPPLLPTTIGTTFDCTAVDARGVSHVLAIEIVTGADGKPTTKLVSVSPTITN